MDLLIETTVGDFFLTFFHVFAFLQTQSNPGKLIISGEVEAVNREAKILKDAGVNIIIALTHAGLPMDLEVAEKCPLVDVVVGGHTHSVLYTGRKYTLTL